MKKRTHLKNICATTKLIFAENDTKKIPEKENLQLRIFFRTTGVLRIDHLM